MRTLITLTLIFGLGFSITISKTQKAMIASALIPGTGEWLLGDKTKGEIFLWLDGAIWLTYFGLSWYGNSKEHDARLFAAKSAGANLDQKSDYYRILESYDNAEEYNSVVMREARYRYPDSVEAQKEYLAKYGYFGDSAWDWESDSARFTYFYKRRSARVTLHQAGLVMGAILINRLVSFLDCALFTPDRNIGKKIGLVPSQEKIGLAIVYKF
ncbi:MAG: hypothetical protein ABIK93_09485 [candidate division WOR-3 bacterium]